MTTVWVVIFVHKERDQFGGVIRSDDVQTFSSKTAAVAHAKKLEGLDTYAEIDVIETVMDEGAGA